MSGLTAAGTGSQYGMSVSLKCCRVPYLILIAGFPALLLQASRKPPCSSTEDLVSRCLMVSPPHLPTAHLLVRTVLALVCFPSPLVCSSIVPYIKLSSSSSPPIHQLYQLNLLFSLLITTGKKVLPLLSVHWLSRWSSHPALLCSQSLKEKEIKHKYRILACKNPWCKGETISLLYFINPISLSLLFAPFCQRLENQCCL